MHELIKEIIQIKDNDEGSIPKICYYLGANYQVVFIGDDDNIEAVIFDYKTSKDEMIESILDEGFYDDNEMEKVETVINTRHFHACRFLKIYADLDIHPDSLNNIEDEE